MAKALKSKLYFFLASYFRFFAAIQLRKWSPQIIVITGSSGKTTLLHLIESQLGEQARYSHHANSSFGIPFDVLGLKRSTLQKTEWLYLLLAAPVKAFKKPYLQKLYVVEADCDRSGEGKFLASWLKPAITVLTGISLTHSMNFDPLVANGKFPTIEKAIAYEFGYFIEYAQDLAIVNGDDDLSKSEFSRARAKVEQIKQPIAANFYQILPSSTEFIIDGELVSISALLPREVFFSIAATKTLVNKLGASFDPSFKNFKLPPGRSSVFAGIKNTTLIDSSYNANLDSMQAILDMYRLYPGNNKWAVLGDMLEQGSQEQQQHEKLAELIKVLNLKKIILMGPRVCKYTYPKLKSILPNSGIIKFEQPRPLLDYIVAEIRGGETILFKGARFLEGVVEHLLQNKSDATKLCRREKIWQIRRKQWGL